MRGARRPSSRSAKKNPGALRQLVTMMAIDLHLGPFSRHVIPEIDRRIAELDAATVVPAPAVPAASYREPQVANA